MDECSELKAKVKQLIENAQITDSDNHGYGSFYEVYLGAELWDEIKEIVEAT